MTLNPEQESFAQEMLAAAAAAGHIWPGYAAAEACLESGWGLSGLTKQALNVFGLKVPSTWTGKTISMPTSEVINGKWVAVTATWPVFESYQQAFEERMNVLRANDIYAPALNATSGEYFVVAVSKHWATDPNRGDKVLATYKGHLGLFAGLVEA